MDEIIGFNNLKVGQQVKVKGQPGPQGKIGRAHV